MALILVHAEFMYSFGEITRHSIEEDIAEELSIASRIPSEDLLDYFSFDDEIAVSLNLDIEARNYDEAKKEVTGWLKKMDARDIKISEI